MVSEGSGAGLIVPAAQWRAHADQLVLGRGRDESQAEPGWTLPPTPPGSGVGSVCQRLSRRPQEHWPGRAGGGERFPHLASWCVSERWATERRGPQAATWPPTPPGPEEGRGRGGPQALAGKGAGAGTKGGRAAGHVGPYRGLHSQGRPGQKRSPPPSCRLATGRGGPGWRAREGGRHLLPEGCGVQATWPVAGWAVSPVHR